MRGNDKISLGTPDFLPERGRRRELVSALGQAGAVEGEAGGDTGCARGTLDAPEGNPARD